MWHINAAGSPVINIIGKLITAATLWCDAHMVVDRLLSVGQFVACRVPCNPDPRQGHFWMEINTRPSPEGLLS
jgi:hypothetical protein